MKLSNLIYLVIIFGLCGELCAWENKRTHPAITDRGITASYIDDYLKTQMGLTNGTSTQLYWNFPQDIKTRIDRGGANPNQTTRNISEWLQVGSTIEDTEDNPDPRRAVAPWRPRHHFHDPTRNTGLDNHTDHPDWEAPFWSSWLPLGQSALHWAISGTAVQEPFTNNENWAEARSIFYDSLRNTTKSARDAQLAESLLKLGCILHLVEDMGVPAHTRNDFLFAHYRSVYTWDWGEPLEMWAEGQVATAGNNIPANWLTGWTPAPKVYSKVSDYFDTDTRNATDYLGDGVSPPGTWGLAESTNYQFFSWSTISPGISSLYYFPHPDVDRCNVREELGRTYLYGYAVNHLARFTMSEDFLQHGHLEQAWCTLGEAIYNDYVRITIPRTIDYATGLVNYFFRGRLNATAECINCNIFELTITNQSRNSGVPQTLKGGTFELYWDDANGNRTPVYDFTVDGWGPGSTLAYGASTTGTFTKPEAEVEGYILVYKGNICANPANLDPDDSEAIAVCKFQVVIPDDCCMEYGGDCECFPSGQTPKCYIIKSGNLLFRCYQPLPEEEPCIWFTGWGLSNSACLILTGEKARVEISSYDGAYSNAGGRYIESCEISGSAIINRYAGYHGQEICLELPGIFSSQVIISWYPIYDCDYCPDPSEWLSEPSYFQTYSPGPPPGIYYFHSMSSWSGGDCVEFYFKCVSGCPGTHDSGWQSSSVYTYAVSTDPNQYGQYKVKTRNAVGTETEWSETKGF